MSFEKKNHSISLKRGKKKTISFELKENKIFFGKKFYYLELQLLLNHLKQKDKNCREHKDFRYKIFANYNMYIIFIKSLEN